MLADGDVRILVDIEVPPEAIAVLGKGLGYVPTPSLDSLKQDLTHTKLQIRLRTLPTEVKEMKPMMKKLII